MSTLLILVSLPLVAETVRLASGEWLPFLSEDLKHYGVGSHIVTEAFALQGIEVEYDFLPWKRNYSSAKNGLYDGSILWANVPDRRAYFIFSHPVVPSENAIFHLKSYAFTADPGLDFSGVKMGLMSGYYYDNSLHMSQFEYVLTEVQNVEKLIRGRIDVFGTDRRVGYYIIRKHFSAAVANRITHSEVIGPHGYYSLALNRKSHQDSDLMARFNLGLSELKRSGRHEQMLRDNDLGLYDPDN